MKEFITESYTSTKRDLESLATEFTSVLKTLDTVILKCIEGKTLQEINMEDVPLLVKTDKAQHLPAFKELLSVGVDLRKQVQLTEKETNDILRLNTLLNKYSSGSQGMGKIAYLPAIQVAKGKAIINTYGLEFIESQKIRLNKQELELWNRIQAVRNYILNDVKIIDSEHLLYSVFGKDLVKDWQRSTDIQLSDFKSLTSKYGVDKK